MRLHALRPHRIPSLHAILDVAPGIGADLKNELVDGVNLMIAALRDHEVARQQADVTVIASSRPTEPLLARQGLVEEVALDGIPAGGPRLLGSAISTALDLIEQSKVEWASNGDEFVRPIVLVTTSGAPEDDPADWASTAERSLQADHRTVAVVPVRLPGAVGGEEINELTLREYLTVRGDALTALFRWLADCVISQANSDNFDTQETRKLTPIPSPNVWCEEDFEDDDPEDDEFAEAWEAGKEHHHHHHDH